MSEISLDLITGDDEEKALCEDYWRLEEPGVFALTVAKVADKHQVSPTGLSRVVSGLCIAYSESSSCRHCATPYAFKSRNDYLNKRSWGLPKAWECDVCLEAIREARKEEREEQDAARHRILEQELASANQDGLSLESVNFRSAVFLLSLLRHAGSEDLSYIAPCDLVEGNLSPTRSFDSELVVYLYNEGLIAIHPGSRKDSVEVSEGGGFAYYPLQVHWVLPARNDDKSAAAFLEELGSLVRDTDWNDNHKSQVAELFQEVALQECIQYLRVVVEDHGFELRVGEKTLLVLKEVLQRYSVAQAYNFMWRAAKDAAAFYMRENTSRRHAANTIPGAIQRMADRASVEGWEVKAYRRDFRAPQSTLSQVLFDVALGIGDGGFTRVPPSLSVAPEGA